MSSDTGGNFALFSDCAGCNVIYLFKNKAICQSVNYLLGYRRSACFTRLIARIENPVFKLINWLSYVETFRRGQVENFQRWLTMRTGIWKDIQHAFSIALVRWQKTFIYLYLELLSPNTTVAYPSSRYRLFVLDVRNNRVFRSFTIFTHVNRFLIVRVIGIKISLIDKVKCNLSIGVLGYRFYTFSILRVRYL